MEKYLFRNENEKPQISSLNLIDDVFKIIEIELDDLSVQRERRYLKDHRTRIAFDVDYTLEFIPQDHKILEVGSAPFFLTGALPNDA